MVISYYILYLVVISIVVSILRYITPWRFLFHEIPMEKLSTPSRLPVAVHVLIGIEGLDVRDHQAQGQAIGEEFIQGIFNVLGKKMGFFWEEKNMGASASGQHTKSY